MSDPEVEEGSTTKPATHGQPTLVDPPIEALLDKVGGSKFTLVVAAASRAREITEYYEGLGQGHGAIFPPQVRSLSNKSLSIALRFGSKMR